MLTISTVVVVGFFAWSVYPYILGDTSAPTFGTTSSAHFAVYQVDGMTCGGCEIAVDGAIEAIGIVDSVKSSFTDGRAYIWYDGANTDLTQFEAAIQSVGFNPTLIESD